MDTNAVRIHPRDNVAVALREIRPGEALSGSGVEGVAARECIPKNHKAALQAVPEGGAVIKYGEKIGVASRPVRAGEWVHTHNLASEEET